MKKYFTKIHHFGGGVHETGGGVPFMDEENQQEPPVDPVPVDPVLAAAGDAREVEQKEDDAEVPATADAVEA